MPDFNVFSLLDIKKNVTNDLMDNVKTAILNVNTRLY